MSTLNQQLHNSATHANGKDASCPTCNPHAYKMGVMAKRYRVHFTASSPFEGLDAFVHCIDEMGAKTWAIGTIDNNVYTFDYVIESA